MLSVPHFRRKNVCGSDELSQVRLIGNVAPDAELAGVEIRKAMLGTLSPLSMLSTATK